MTIQSISICRHPCDTVQISLYEFVFPISSLYKKKKTCIVGTMPKHIKLKTPKIPLTLMMPGCMQYPPCLSATRATITVAALSRTDWSILLSISSWTRPCISQMWLDRKSDCRQSTIAWVDHGNRCISLLKTKPLPCNKKKKRVS